jgi:hypothetical protein
MVFLCELVGGTQTTLADTRNADRIYSMTNYQDMTDTVKSPSELMSHMVTPPPPSLSMIDRCRIQVLGMILLLNEQWPISHSGWDNLRQRHPSYSHLQYLNGTVMAKHGLRAGPSSGKPVSAQSCQFNKGKVLHHPWIRSTKYNALNITKYIVENQIPNILWCQFVRTWHFTSTWGIRREKE